MQKLKSNVNKESFSKKGLSDRQAGMNKESRQTKMIYAIIFGVAAFIYFIFAAYSLTRATNAGRINKEYDDEYSYYDLAYDSC